MLARSFRFQKKKGKKVTWDMGNILKTNQDTSPRSLPIDEKKKGKIDAGAITRTPSAQHIAYIKGI